MLSVNGRNHVLRHVLFHVTQKIVELWKDAQSIKLRLSSSESKVTWGGYVLKSRVEENEEEENRINDRKFFELNVGVDW